MQPIAMDDALRADFEVVSAARVYFGHQSVGANIIDGLEDLQVQIGRQVIRVRSLDSLDAVEKQGVLMHTKVGRNKHPVSKCHDFQQILDRKLHGRVDVALFKFCYVDFDDASDVGTIFNTYSRTLDDLKQRYPTIIFIHVTAPLRSVAGGPGVWVRERLGRPNRSKLANVRRNEFNRRLREKFEGDPVFDLARVMSTYPDGSRETFKVSGDVYESLVPAYTDDGGHLDDIGRTYAAAEFVRSIAEAIRHGEKEPNSTEAVTGAM